MTKKRNIISTVKNEIDISAAAVEQNEIKFLKQIEDSKNLPINLKSNYFPTKSDTNEQINNCPIKHLERCIK